MVLNVGDKITSKDGIYQKDQFHIMQEIVRDVPKEYRNIISELVKTKQFSKISRFSRSSRSTKRNRISKHGDTRKSNIQQIKEKIL